MEVELELEPNETQRVHGPSIGGRTRHIQQWFFLGEVVIWMEKISCVQPHVHEICCKLDARKKEIAIYKICNNSKASLKLRNKVYGVK